MARQPRSQIPDLFGVRRAGRPGFFASPEEFDEVYPPLPYAHAVRRAWAEMSLAGVLYVGRSPVAYFKEMDELADSSARRLQRALWNHAVVPLLVIVCPTKVYVYTGRALPAKPGEAPGAGNRLVRILDRTSEALEVRQLVHSIETGRIQSDRPECFDREKVVDRYLLHNLDAARTRLAEEPAPLELKTIHALLTRVLFTCYLIERRVIVGKHFTDPRLRTVGRDGGLGPVLSGLSADDARDLLYCLFARLKSKFNGCLFDASLAEEKATVSDGHMRVIQSFLRGDDLGARQLSLGFWAYDFSIIPVETISAIYESFLDAEGRTTRRISGAYYTPPHLAELAVGAGAERLGGRLLGKRVLDPACGSGVFLVSAFNRMAEEWRRANPRRRRKTRAQKLIDILQNQIFGVETNETACRIACFSLYLAVLDQLDPPDIQALEDLGQRLPQLLLAEGERQPADDPRPIVCGNFFDPRLGLPQMKFDLIVGNPPWVSRGRSKDKTFLRWVKRQNHNERPVPGNQIAHGFMWEVPRFLSEDGVACLLLPSAVLLNKTTSDFQAKWFSAVTVDKVVNLSDLSFLLFPGAKRPAVIARFSSRRPEWQTDRVTYENPKTDVQTQVGGPVYVYPEDVTSLRLTDLARHAGNGEAPVFWKSHFWATGRDLRLLDRLMDLPPLRDVVGTPRNPKRFVTGQGFKPSSPKSAPNDTCKPWWPPDYPFVDAKRHIKLVLLEEDCEKVNEYLERIRRPTDRLHRSPDRELFLPPMVVVSQGASKAAFVDFPVLFRHALQSIKGSPKDRDVLVFLATVLNSDIATYFYFHTAANWGTERDKVLFSELLRLPFPLPQDTRAPRRAQQITGEVARMFATFVSDHGAEAMGREQRVTDYVKAVRPLIHEYYEVDEQESVLIEDTVSLFEPSSTPPSPLANVPTLNAAQQEDRRAYVELLCRTLNGLAGRGGSQVSGSVTRSSGAGTALVTLRRSQSQLAYTEVDASDQLAAAMRRIANSLPYDEGGFIRHRSLIIFQPDEIDLLKPPCVRAWARTSALNDADEIVGAILRGKKGE